MANAKRKARADLALVASLAAVALVLLANIVWVDLSAAGSGERADAGTQRAFHVLGAAALVALAGAVLFWVVQHARGRPPAPEATGTEALLGIAERAGDYLRGLYLLLWVAGAYLVAFGFVLIPFGDALGIAYQAVAPSSGFSEWIALLLGGFWAATFVVWLVYLVRVRREWRRWRGRIEASAFHA